MPRPPSPFVQHLLDLLLPFGDVSARRMFGGYGIYRDGLMFGLVAHDEFYLKVDELTKPVFEEAGLEPFSFEMKNGKVGVMSYHRVPEGALSSPMAMKKWALLGWEAAQRNAASKKTQKRRK